MRAASSRTITRLLLVVAGLAPALLLGCSSAGRMFVAQDPRTPARLDLAASPASKPGSPVAGHRSSSPLPPPAGVDASGPVYPSPDGRWIAFESDRDGVHGVWVAQPDGERARRLSGHRIAVRPRWSPDGARLVFLARDTRRSDLWNIWLADFEEPAPRKLPSAGGVPLEGAAWFPDSRHICYGSDNWLTVIDTRTSEARAYRLSEGSNIIGLPVVSPDGRRVVFAVEGDGAWMVSLDDGAVAQVVDENDVDAFAWAPGGRQIAFRTARDGQWKVRIIK